MGLAEEKGFSLISDVALISNGAVLLVRYADSEEYDGQSGWFLPDAAIDYLEHPDKAARRLLADQLGLTSVEPTLDHIESFRGNDGSWHLAFHYKSVLANGSEVNPSASVSDARWFQLSALPEKSEVAHHGWALGILEKMHIPA